uniref:Uncharacterized protein n=1 Tax=Rangifer tarandus platyrhynchus TaxID=3082113 RepID=A0ACB0ELP6_RANTA|nr:unnamed protein product [Rangifer tarandus platyrhynchus]
MLAVPGVYGCPCCVFPSRLITLRQPWLCAITRRGTRLARGILSGETGGPEEQGEPGWAESGATEALGKHNARGTAEGPALSAVRAACSRPPPGGGASPSSAPRVSHA